MPEIVLVTDMWGERRSRTILHLVWQPTMFPRKTLVNMSVTDMRVEWRAGTPFQTVWKSTMSLRENMVDRLAKTPSGEPMPSAMSVRRPPVQVNAWSRPFWKGFGSTVCFGPTAALSLVKRRQQFQGKGRYHYSKLWSRGLEKYGDLEKGRLIYHISGFVNQWLFSILHISSFGQIFWQPSDCWPESGTGFQTTGEMLT